MLKADRGQPQWSEQQICTCGVRSDYEEHYQPGRQIDFSLPVLEAVAGTERLVKAGQPSRDMEPSSERTNEDQFDSQRYI